MTIKQYIHTSKVTCPHCDFEYSDAPPRNAIVLFCQNCEQMFDLEIKRLATGRRTQDTGQSLPHDEILSLYTTCPHVEQKYDLTTIKSYDEAARLYEARKITNAELTELVNKHTDWKVVPFFNGYENKWIDQDANPFYADGDNKSRQHGFKYHFKHPKGMVFQIHIKNIIRQMIDVMYGSFVALYGQKKTNALKRFLIKKAIASIPGTIGYLNKTMATRYDKDAFVFDDPFLTSVREISLKHIKEYFQWTEITEEPLIKGLDIGLAVMKEDLVYCMGAKMILNDIIKKHPNGFELTETEKEHIKFVQTKVAERKVTT